ncbi:uncharacterized protein PV09_06013 [Verruconis gallopava]|uniref:Uncharacterized protein n=1 Tax=Verruconis gallopava TaxID=253628 RepID=A0A0D2A758_9PEZI|nr:uncharacterized protein PV09_06013 [Verruconis gallopava]KIW02558.1 hypothetical protein PV09_06013 [Verruconis gallopava]
MNSPPASPLHRRQSSNFSTSSSKRLSQTMSFSRRSSAAFGASHGSAGVGDSLAFELAGEEFGESLADELDGFSDGEEALEEEDEAQTPAEQERDSGIDVASSPPEGGGGKHLSPQSALKQTGHRRKESAYDGSEYGSESDLEESELISAGLEARMSAVEAMARRGLEENGSEGDKVVSRLTERLRDLGSQSEMEMGTTRLSTAYTALSTHLTNQTRILSQLTSHLMSPLTPIYVHPDLLSEMEPVLDATLASISTLHPSSRPPLAIHTLLSETADLIQDLNYLKDTLQVNQQTTTVGARKLRVVKDLLREAREEMNSRDESVRWIEQGCWDQRLREREAETECNGILRGFEMVCEGWGERLKEGIVAA